MFERSNTKTNIKVSMLLGVVSCVSLGSLCFKEWICEEQRLLNKCKLVARSSLPKQPGFDRFLGPSLGIPSELLGPGSVEEGAIADYCSDDDFTTRCSTKWNQGVPRRGKSESGQGWALLQRPEPGPLHLKVV